MKKRGRPFSKLVANTQVTDNVFKIEKGHPRIARGRRASNRYAAMLLERVMELTPLSNESITITKTICETRNAAFNLLLNVRRLIKTKKLGIVLVPTTLADADKNYVGIRIWREA
jgi:hypothetical protein